MTRYEEPTDFAWVITKDHLYEGSSALYDEIGVSDAKGTTGPREAPAELTNFLGDPANFLKRGITDSSGNPVHLYSFHMYDDDGILYYSGKLGTYTDNPSDEALYAPLADYGGPNAGAVLIKYANHPEWTMEY